MLFADRITMHRRQFLGAIGTGGLSLVAGCSDGSQTSTTPTAASFTLTSPAFEPGGPIPDKYGKEYRKTKTPH
jgi:hypothetical protein